MIARSSNSRYAHELLDIRSAGKALGARYVMEGSLRQAGAKMRIAVQLVDTNSGAHLWAETYDRSFSPAVFELQGDVVSRIVSTVADSHGVLPHSMSEAVRSKGSDQLTPYEALLHSFGYFERVSAEEHVVTRDNLERAVQQAPGHADCLAMLTIVYVAEYIHGFKARPDPLVRLLWIPHSRSGKVRHFGRHARMHPGRLARVGDHMADRAVISQRHGDHVVKPYLWARRRLDCAGQPDIRIDEDAVHA